MKKLSILGVLLLLLATMSVTFAQTAQTVNLTMNPVGGSKVSGTAAIAASGNGIQVTVKLAGFDPNTEHAGHIHSGTCEQGGPVVFPLTSIKADAQGGGSVTSTVDNATFAAVTDGKHYVQYHAANNPPGAGVSCANIPASTGGQGGAPAGGTGSTTSAPASAPATGSGGLNSSGSPTLALLAGFVVALLLAGTAYTRLARRKR